MPWFWSRNTAVPNECECVPIAPRDAEAQDAKPSEVPSVVGRGRHRDVVASRLGGAKVVYAECGDGVLHVRVSPPTAKRVVTARGGVGLRAPAKANEPIRRDRPWLCILRAKRA